MLFATVSILLVATALWVTTCERTVFSGRNSDESRESLPGSALSEGTVAQRELLDVAGRRAGGAP